MNLLIYSYRESYSNPLFQRIFGIICLLITLSVTFGYLFQITIESVCHTKSFIIFLTSLVFWGITGTWISLWSKIHSSKKHFWLIMAGIGLIALILNQILVRTSVNFCLYYIYHCQDDIGGWLPYLFANNLIINSLCYIGLASVGVLEAKKSQEISNEYKDTPDIEQAPTLLHTSLEKIKLKNGNQILWLPVNEIIWIEADNNCITFVTQKQKFVSYQTLKSVESSLNPAQFVRIHRATILNKSFITKVINLSSGDALVEVSQGEKLKVSRTYKKNILS